MQTLFLTWSYVLELALVLAKEKSWRVQRMFQTSIVPNSGIKEK
jgi:hypothetical protein